MAQMQLRWAETLARVLLGHVGPSWAAAARAAGRAARMGELGRAGLK